MATMTAMTTTMTTMMPVETWFPFEEASFAFGQARPLPSIVVVAAHVS